MPARALLLSLLSRQHLLLKQQAFGERYPHPWLVWEAGAWNVPEVGEELGATRLPSREMADCLPESDVLCFELALDGEGRELELGRSPECDLVVNDATVSRVHLTLGFDGRHWWARPFPDSARTTVNGVAMDEAHRTPLLGGVRLTVGDAVLTFYTPDGFLARVQGQAERMSKAAAAS
jgi:hypothetical protein